MITNGTVVSDALQYVNGKAEKLSAAAQAEEEENISFEAEEEERTTNDVF